MIDEAYEAIVTTSERPVLTLAGPGAGKTYLLGDRVKRLLEMDIPNSCITVLAFGKDASQNMRCKLVDPKDGFGIPYDRLPRVSTMHSLGMEILLRSPRLVGLRKDGLTLQPNEDAKRLLFRDSAMSLGLGDAVGASARHCKERGCPERGKQDPDCRVCEMYWGFMSRCNLVDYDDLVLFACDILYGDEGILREYQASATHLLVDEYQDINEAQFRLIELLSRRNRNGLFAVGDDAQSIYGFRGGDPRFILDFARSYPEALIAPLAHSRRCHEGIMKCAGRMLKPFYPAWKGPFTLQYHRPPEKPPVVWQVPSDEAEANIIARIAKEAMAKKKSLLVLAPKKDFFPLISLVLSKQRIPHQRPANMLSKSVSDRLETIFAILRWVNNPGDSFLARIALEAVINHGAAKVAGASRSKKLKKETITRRLQVETEIAAMWEGVGKTRSLWDCLSNLPSSASEDLRRAHTTLAGLLETCSEFTGKLKGEFAKRLALAVGSWAEPDKLVEDMSAIHAILSDDPPAGFAGVQLITMKKAKGLEADVVVMAGLEDDILPNPSSPLEEEARLFYVSMTRAKESLIMIHAYKRRRNISYGPEITNKARSRFIDATGIQSLYKKF